MVLWITALFFHWWESFESLHQYSNSCLPSVPGQAARNPGLVHCVHFVHSHGHELVVVCLFGQRFRLRRKKSKSLAAFAPKMERREEEITDSLSVVQKAMRTALDTPDRVQARICGEIGGPYERSSSSDESEFEFKDDGEVRKNNRLALRTTGVVCRRSQSGRRSSWRASA